MATPKERKTIKAAASDFESKTVSFLKRLVQTPSVNPPGDYEDIYDLLSSVYDDLGWEVDTVWTPEDMLQANQLEYPRPNMLVYVSKGEESTIALHSHFDTVPIEEDEWDRDPFDAEIDDRYLYGRGATDEKSQIAATTLAGLILEEAELIPDETTLVLPIVADEETGGETGTGVMLDSGKIRPEYVIGQGKSESIIHAMSGVNGLQVNIKGKTTHANNPHKGANAVMAGSDILDIIAEYNNDLLDRESKIKNIDSPVCTATVFEGGIKRSVVPGSASISVDQRVPPDFDSERLEDEFREIIANKKLPQGTDAEVELVEKFSPYRSSPDSPHIQSVKENGNAIFYREIPVAGYTGASDVSYYNQYGAKIVHFGPGDSESNIHGADERVSIDQVRMAGAVIAASVLDMARI